jgi:hypothetical protein
MQIDDKHYITLLPILRIFEGQVKNMEPHKLEKWEWITWDEVRAI